MDNPHQVRSLTGANGSAVDNDTVTIVEDNGFVLHTTMEWVTILS